MRRLNAFKIGKENTPLHQDPSPTALPLLSVTPPHTAVLHTNTQLTASRSAHPVVNNPLWGGHQEGRYHVHGCRLCQSVEKHMVCLLLAAHRLLRLLRQHHRLDVGQRTSLHEGHTANQFVQLLVVLNRQLQVTRNNTRLLVVAHRITRQLHRLGS